MLFQTHLLAGLVAGRLSSYPTLWVFAGVALPDLIDKPLGRLGVFDLYHTIGHSALFAVVLVPIALVWRHGVAVVAGWGLHLVMDAVHIVINGRLGDTVFLAWPILLPKLPIAIPPGSFFFYYLGTRSFYIEVVFWLLVLGTLARRWWRGEPLVELVS